MNDYIFVAKELGILDTSNELDKYSALWQEKAISPELLTQVANWCFKHNIKSLETYNKVLEQVLNLGVTDLTNLETQLVGILPQNTSSKNDFIHNNYTPEQINGFMTDLNTVEV